MPRVAKHNVEKPHLDSGFGNKELDKVEKQFDAAEKDLAKLTVDEMRKAPLSLDPPQTKISKSEVEKYDAPVIRHCKSQMMPIPKTGYDKAKFEKLIAEDEELIKVVCENNEVIGEHIELWCGNYPGQILGFYKVPVNIPIWLPRKVARAIRRCKYHRVKMAQRPLHSLQSEMDSGSVFSQPIESPTVTETKQRLDCRMAANDF